MHVVVKSFLETDFASYLRISELKMEGLRQLCGDPDVEEKRPDDSTSRARPSSIPSGFLCYAFVRYPRWFVLAFRVV
ncbi:unnamed protein product [Lactuca virosa]|uniref:Uncharacterized protein n=1 Tax=Lactuca virosa TaxID=75947 RepID=A0AAU9MRT7_9ASTR|nr:unnamed protein product [Lactuca virosa]